MDHGNLGSLGEREVPDDVLKASVAQCFTPPLDLPAEDWCDAVADRCANPSEGNCERYREVCEGAACSVGASRSSSVQLLILVLGALGVLRRRSKSGARGRG